MRCRLAASIIIQSGILQVLRECETPFHEKGIFMPTQSQTLTAVDVGHEVLLVFAFPLDALTDWELARAVFV